MPSTTELPDVAHQKLLKQCRDHNSSAPAYFAALRAAVSSALREADGGSSKAAAAASEVLEAGVACLHKFMQVNLCG